MHGTTQQHRADEPTDIGDIAGVSPGAALLREELLGGTMERLDTLNLGTMTVDICRGHDAVWTILRRAGKGGLAMRAAFCPAGYDRVRLVKPKPGEMARVEIDSVIGRQRIAVKTHDDALPALRVTTTLEPRAPLLASYVPRDLYPLDANDDPLLARGNVEAAQRGLNTGAIYFRVEEPAFGSVLYFQNLTALNDYFNATGTKPDGAVGGLWPELGFLLPTPPLQGTPTASPLPAGRETVISDALLLVHEDPAGSEQDMAHRYLSLLGAAMRHIDLPPTDYRDWVERAERSLNDLAQSPKATIRHYGHLYVHPYTDAEYPDSMVQLTVLAAIRDYEVWSGTKRPIGAELAAGIGKFYDAKLHTLRRYLPNVGKDKNRNAVDSWYLYHPLTRLGRLAIDGDKQARRLFDKSIDFGIRAAHHFDYKWPIQYDLRDFKVIQAARNDEGLGQTDVGGIYAYVMLQAFELTDDKRFLDEARAAIDAARGMRFELNYQANLTAWGATACLRLWRITNEESYLRQSYVYLASFFQNTAMWESEIGHARHYRNFMGATALHDAPYMAMYECFDSFAAFERYFKDSGPDIDPAVRLLLANYCRYALDRAWYYYPDTLPEDVIAPQQRENNGHVDRSLSFPVEDLYVDGQRAGQVGQEIYGVGAAFVFATRAFHPVRDAPFLIFCDHFVLSSDRPSDRALSFQLGGGAGFQARVALVRSGKEPLPAFHLAASGGDAIELDNIADDRIDYTVPADGLVAITW